jgi:hypothetical protein
MDLNNLSSNILLIGLVLISLCCLYLLYSNFSKVREIEELKRRVEDLKKIFLNQQAHNEETFSNIKTVITALPGLNQQPNANANTNIKVGSISNTDARNHDFQNINNSIANEVVTEIAETVKTVNLASVNNNSNILDSYDLRVNKEGYQNGNNTSTEKNTHQVTSNVESVIEEKEINLDLEDLDNLNEYQIDDNLSINDLDDNCEEIDVEMHTSCKINNSDSSITSDSIKLAELIDKCEIQITKDNLFIIEPIISNNNEIFDDIEDNLSIATEPIGDSNDIINNTTNFNLDDIKDIDDIDDINDINDNDDILNDILDCKTDQTKPDNKEVKIIQINDKLDGKLDDKLDDKPHINISEVELDLDEILSGKHYKPIKTSESVNTKEDNTDKNENIKKIEVTDSSKSTLHNMSHKQLKDLAKSHKLKTTGTKQELIALLEKVSSQ